MKPSDDLFQLIKSLSRSERRHLSIYTNKKLRQDPNNYMLLFDAIDKQDEYDEEKLKEGLEDTTFVNRLPEVKNYLYNLILKIIRDYHSGKAVELQIRSLIDYAYILYHKNLHDQSLKQIIKARNLARRYEHLPLLLEALFWQLQTNLIDPRHDRSRAGLLENIQATIDQIGDLVGYKNLNQQLLEEINKGGLVRDSKRLSKLQSILDHPLMQKEPASSLYAKISYHHIHGLSDFAAGDYDANSEHTLRQLELFEEHEDQLVDPSLLREYTTTLTNHFHARINRRDYQECRRTLTKLAKVRKNSVLKSFPQFESNLEATFYYLRIWYYIETGEFNRAVEECRFLGETIDTHHSSSFQHYFNCKAAYAYFGVGDYENALEWINRVLNIKSPPSLYNDTTIHIFNIIIHFELDNFSGVEYLLRSTYRRLQNKQKLYKFEHAFFRHIRRGWNLGSPDELRNTFRTLREELQTILDDPFERNALDGFDLPSWLDSKVEGTPFEEVVRRKAGKDITEEKPENQIH